MLVESQMFQKVRQDEFMAGNGFKNMTRNWVVEIRDPDSQVLVVFPVVGELEFESYAHNQKMSMRSVCRAEIIRTGKATKFCLRNTMDGDMWLSGDVGDAYSDAEMKWDRVVFQKGNEVWLDSFRLYY